MSNIVVPLPIDKHLCLSLSFSHHHISHICYQQTPLAPNYTKNSDLAFAQKIKYELECYFERADSQFSVLCDLSAGSEFQKKVWQALLEIPVGETQTYGFLANKLNTSARAIGNACRCNLFPVIVPCHRVVSASGIGGYAGDTLLEQQGQIDYIYIKQWLLSHESTFIVTMHQEK